jgi:hypothetical protein
MKAHACLLALIVSTAVACGGESDGGEGLGHQVGGVVSDTQVLKEAQTAANQIIRNQTDCETVKANIEDVNRRLDEAEGRVQTSTGRTTIAALKKQVKNIAETCGVM